MIGSGSPSQAKRFQAEEKIEGVVVTDPSLEAYRIAGMKRGVLKTLNPKSMINAVRAFRSGSRQTGTKGDPWQQGGVLVVSSIRDGGKVLLQHAASEAGDPTDFRAVVKTLDQLAATA